MARKSRTAICNQPSIAETPQVFPTAIYARLSVENSGKAEDRDVISNQVAICKSYIKERPYLRLTDTYIDNGRTGTVFDRPEFNRLMDDIRSGTIKCLVVRDLSRFGRDYVETGTYMERLFPQIGLRFISVKEMYDSFDAAEGNEGLLLLFFGRIASVYAALLLYPRLALISITLSHRKQKYLLDLFLLLMCHLVEL